MVSVPHFFFFFCGSACHACVRDGTLVCISNSLLGFLALWWAVDGQGEGAAIQKRRLSYALFLTLRNFATFRWCLGHGNGRCPWDVLSTTPVSVAYVLPHWLFAMGVYAPLGVVYCIITSAWVSRCSFDIIGQCEGPSAWNEWLVRISTLEPNIILHFSDYQIIHSIFFVIWYHKVPV